MKRLSFILAFVLFTSVAYGGFIAGNPSIGSGGGSSGLTNDAYTAESVPNTAPVATATDALAAGDGAGATGINSISFGVGSSATQTGNTSVGNNSDVTGTDGTGFGDSVIVDGNSSTAVGDSAEARALFTTSYGAFAEAREQFGTAVGVGAQAGRTDGGTTEASATSVGRDADAYETNCTAVGAGSRCGKSGSSTDPDGVAVGFGALADESASIVIGANGNSGADQQILIGPSLAHTGANTIKIGNGLPSGSGADAVVIGTDHAAGPGSSAVGIGPDVDPSGSFAICIGILCDATLTNSIAIGALALSVDQSAIALGRESATRYASSMSIKFSDIDNGPQRIMAVWEKTTTDATPGVMLGQGETNGFPITSGEAYYFDVVVLGKDTLLNMGVYSFNGVIKNVAGITSFVIAPTVSVDHEDVALWDVTVAANDTNDTLDITVTGAASTTINWGVKIEMLEL